VVHVPESCFPRWRWRAAADTLASFFGAAAGNVGEHPGRR
jgi:hypothetical protein